MSGHRIYLDTSAVAKLLIREEPGAELAAELVAGADELHTSLLTYPETISALAGARRDRRLSADGLDSALARFETLWPRFEVVQFSARIAGDAAEYILRFPLSGADAVQIASTLETNADNPLTFVTWDRRQAEAAQSLGLLVQPSID